MCSLRAGPPPAAAGAVPGVAAASVAVGASRGGRRAADASIAARMESTSFAVMFFALAIFFTRYELGVPAMNGATTGGSLPVGRAHVG